ncbi:unnamed protein product [Symbiodinium sp. CCMP2592]|nr:unnamed protein product [Symbiodinium sp. CCMP2592]
MALGTSIWCSSQDMLLGLFGWYRLLCNPTNVDTAFPQFFSEVNWLPSVEAKGDAKSIDPDNSEDSDASPRRTAASAPVPSEDRPDMDASAATAPAEEPAADGPPPSRPSPVSPKSDDSGSVKSVAVTLDESTSYAIKARTEMVHKVLEGLRDEAFELARDIGIESLTAPGGLRSFITPLRNIVFPRAAEEEIEEARQAELNAQRELDEAFERARQQNLEDLQEVEAVPHWQEPTEAELEAEAQRQHQTYMRDRERILREAYNRRRQEFEQDLAERFQRRRQEFRKEMDDWYEDACSRAGPAYRAAMEQLRAENERNRTWQQALPKRESQNP